MYLRFYISLLIKVPSNTKIDIIQYYFIQNKYEIKKYQTKAKTKINSSYIKIILNYKLNIEAKKEFSIYKNNNKKVPKSNIKKVVLYSILNL